MKKSLFIAVVALAIILGVQQTHASLGDSLDNLLNRLLEKKANEQLQLLSGDQQNIGFSGNVASLSIPTTTQSTGSATGSLFIGSLLPSNNNQFDLGSVSNKWRNVFIAGASSSFGGTTVFENGFISQASSSINVTPGSVAFNVTGGINTTGTLQMSSSTVGNYTVSTSGAVYMGGLQPNPLTDEFVCWEATGVSVGELTHEAANCTVSARRFKDNIRPLDLSLQSVLGMRPVQFTNKTNNKEEVGFIAEEMAEIDKRVVVFDADGQTRTIDYDKLTAYLAGAIQEQQKQINELQKEVEALKKPGIIRRLLGK